MMRVEIDKCLPIPNFSRVTAPPAYLMILRLAAPRVFCLYEEAIFYILYFNPLLSDTETKSKIPFQV